MIFNYFALQLKRSLIAFSQMLLSVIAMVALAASLAWGISSYFSNVELLNTVTIGVVIPEGSKETEMVINLVSGMESVQSICEFEFVDSEKMMAGLKTGRYQVAVELTADFYDDVNTGVNTPLTVYFSGDEDLSKSVFRELLYDGIAFTQVTEASIYSVVDLREYHELKMSVHDTEEFLTEYYLWQIFKRGQTFNSVVLSATGEVNFGQYYFTVAVLFFMLLGSLLFGFLYKEEENDLLQALTVRGLSPLHISFVRMFIIEIYAYATLSVCYLAGCFVCSATDTRMLRLDAKVFIMLIPISFSMAAFSHLLYSVAKSRVIGTLLLMGINFVMLVLSGGILPTAFMPGFLQKAGELLPLHYWMQYLNATFFRTGLHISVWGTVIFTLAIFIVSTVVTSYRLWGTCNITGIKQKGQ